MDEKIVEKTRKRKERERKGRKKINIQKCQKV